MEQTIQSNVTGLQCVHCGRTYAAEEVDYFCPACGYHQGILDVQYDYEFARWALKPSALAVDRNNFFLGRTSSLRPKP